MREAFGLTLPRVVERSSEASVSQISDIGYGSGALFDLIGAQYNVPPRSQLHASMTAACSPLLTSLPALPGRKR